MIPLVKRMVRPHIEGIEGDRTNIFDQLTAEEMHRVKFDEVGNQK
jgi:hypothetical protein